MITKDDIKKLKGNLKRGDQKAIATLTGLSAMQIGNFFNGNEDLVSDQTALVIIEATSKIIKQRNKLKATSERILKSI
jgi:hypothetical protein